MSLAAPLFERHSPSLTRMQFFVDVSQICYHLFKIFTGETLSAGVIGKERCFQCSWIWSKGEETREILSDIKECIFNYSISEQSLNYTVFCSLYFSRINFDFGI